ncbi:MAG: hypothetical protein NDF56_07680, partial [archaeon GB-1845-036]|nr:hypothetical protein [Candidatus Culexmicrobium thermophilum]
EKEEGYLITKIALRGFNNDSYFVMFEFIGENVIIKGISWIVTVNNTKHIDGKALNIEFKDMHIEFYTIRVPANIFFYKDGPYIKMYNAEMEITIEYWIGNQRKLETLKINIPK